MNCTTARRELGPNRGPRPQAALCAAWDHVAQCTGCTAFYAEQTAIADRLGALPSLAAPRPLRGAITRSIQKESGWQPWLWAVPLAAAASLVLLAVTQFSSGDALARPLAEAAQLESELTIATAVRPDIEAWLERTMGYRIEIPDIQDAALVGARVADIGGQRSAAVVYMTRGMPLTYFALPTDEVMGHKVSHRTVVAGRSAGYEVALWTEQGRARAVAAPLPRSEIMAIANECRSKAQTD